MQAKLLEGRDEIAYAFDCCEAVQMLTYIVPGNWIYERDIDSNEE